MIIRALTDTDLPTVAKIHATVFVRQQHSLDWLRSSYHASPKNLLFILEHNNDTVGYIIWAQKSGFRPEVVLELEQIAILPSHQGKGMGLTLIRQSLDTVKAYLMTQNAVLKHVLVSTRADNYAQQLYRKALGAEVEATLSNLYSADEVFMVARNV